MNFRQKTLTSVIAVLLTAGGIIGVAACGSDDDNSSNNGSKDSIGSILIGGYMPVVGSTSIIDRPSTSIMAVFYSEPQYFIATGTPQFGCNLVRDNIPDDAGSVDVVRVSAGDINVKIGDKSGVLTWDDAQKVYPPFTGDGNWIAGGEDVSVDAKGDAVPPFSTNLKAPHPVTITSDLTAIKAGSDYKLIWNNGAISEIVQVQITNLHPSDVLALSCTFDSSAGTGTIPGTMLAEVGAGNIMFSVSSATSTRVSVGANKADVYVGVDAVRTVDPESIE